MKNKNHYICNGEMAEWSNAAVLKTVFRPPAERGFESLFLRQTCQISPAVQTAGFFRENRPVINEVHRRKR